MGNALGTLKPMLGASVERKELVHHLTDRGPLLASFKLDGIRALVKDGVVLSRSLKPIPNQHVQNLFGVPAFEGFDGELIVDSPTAGDVFRVTTSGVMSEDGEPNVRYFVFDLWNQPNAPFHQRVADLRRRISPPDVFTGMGGSRIIPVTQVALKTIEEVDLFALEASTLGYEGLVLRSPFGLYKFGRSTVKEAGLLKVKPFVDAEAECVGVVELMHNENEATKDNLGHTKRSSAKAGKVPGGTMGTLVCRTPEGVEFEVGTGFTQDDRFKMWMLKPIGAIVKYKSLNVGVKDKPRHAVFLGFRHKEDM